ncbi:MAG: GMC family oxidoreductase N-terminal domain-containing protein [Bacteroidota bacterium]
MNNNKIKTGVDDNSETQMLEQYDYIVVGAGSAGCVITRRLIDSAKATVLLLEAGGDYNEIETVTNPMQWLNNIGAANDYFYQYQPSPLLNDRVISAPRGKQLGGSGSINALVWARGNQADYNNWAAAGNRGWDYESVLPFFKKIEDWEGGENSFHGVKGPIHVETAKNIHPVGQALIDAGVSFGLPFLEDTNGPNPEGVGAMSMNTLNGKRCSPFRGYLQPVLNNPMLSVLKNAQVLNLIIEGTHCTGVEFLYEGKKVSIKASKEVILSAGTFETPRILMLSGIGPQTELKGLGIQSKIDLPGVGKNLQDHPLIASVCFEANEAMGSPTHNLLGSAVYAKSSKGKDHADLMIIPAQAALVSPEIGSKYPLPENAFSLLPTLVKVKSRGFLKISSAAYDAPLIIQPNFLSDSDDMEAMVSAVELCLALAAEPTFKKLIKKNIVPEKLGSYAELVGFIKNACQTYFHPIGTCGMGNGIDAVVDNQLKVHGIDGLRIADASIMPQITTGNTNAPTMMIAEFATQLLLA